MSNATILMNDRSRSELSAKEQRDFRFIVGNARNAGWIDAADELVATRTTLNVVVSVNCAQRDARTKSYADDERWLFEFLRDLASGRWRSAQ